MKISPLWKQVFTERLLKTTIRTPSQFNLPPNAIRFAVEKLCWAFPQNKDVKIRPLKLASLQAEEIKPQVESTQLILHIHGGAFFLGSINTHRAFLTHMAARTQMQVIHLNYPLAPENRYPKALDALFDVYQALLSQGVQAKDIILSGDSCGANLAVALALKIQAEGLTQASGLMLQSPFLDLTLTSESLRYNQTHDALLSIDALETGIEYYLPTAYDPADPFVSPLFADLSGLPPTLVQVGSKEILLDDGKRFYEKAQAAGVKVEFKLYTGMWHNFQMFTMFDEAQAALDDLAVFAQRLDVD
jgi:epsilon-lactone hydrolase